MAFNYSGARGTALRALHFSRLGRRSRLLLAPFGKAELLVDANDEELGRTVFVRGDYERTYMEAALSYLETSEGYSCFGKIFVDVGANIGTSTVDALVHFGFSRAICFEPDSRNFKLLRLNLLLNDLEGRALAIPIALSEMDANASLKQSPRNFGDSRITKPGTGGDSMAGEGVVECRSFDSLLKAGAVSLENVGMLWVDTQGHEAFVLKGAASVREAGIPTVIEYWPDGLYENRSLDLLEEIVSSSYRTAIDLRMLCHGLEAEAVIGAGDLSSLRGRYSGGEHTDLLLIR